MILTALLAIILHAVNPAASEEADYYRIDSLQTAEDVVLEVSGMLTLEGGRIMVATRRGQIFVIDNTFADDGSAAELQLFADGLQEPLGLLQLDGWIYCVQRAELSRMKDRDGDGKVDDIEVVCDSWAISGNYHEYAFGPRLGGDGNLWLTTNKPFGEEPFGSVAWRGFAMRVNDAGEMLPTCAGLRSPAGIEASPAGDMFYTDNQGEWCGASKLAHLEEGDFHGHPHGIESCKDPLWTYAPIEQPPDGELMPEVAASNKSFKLPAVWFPYDKMGRSPAGFVWDQTDGGFGPFRGQVFVGDQYSSEVMRVFLERVNGRWQGACFPFRKGLQSGVIRVAFDQRSHLIVGMSNRGWGSLGNATEGLQRIVWNGKVPFEVLEMRATAEGFALQFTHPVDVASVSDLSSYRMESYTYKLHSEYGSPEVDRAEPLIQGATLAADGLTVQLKVEGRRSGYVHELHLPGVKSAQGLPLLHGQAYYTLVEVPN